MVLNAASTSAVLFMRLKDKLLNLKVDLLVSPQLSLFLKMDDKLHRQLSCDIFPSKFCRLKLKCMIFHNKRSKTAKGFISMRRFSSCTQI